MTVVVQPPGWSPTRGFANGVVASGRLLAISGQTGADRTGQLVSKDFVRQFDQALANVLEVVAAAGGSARNVVSLTVYVIDRLQYLASVQEVGAAWRLRDAEHTPALTVVEVKSLLDGDALLEVQAFAALP